jgi:Holliday junction resolvase
VTGKPINSRAKGAQFERTIAQRLEGLTGVRFKRNLEQSRAVDHCDILADDPDWPFSIECKRVATGTGCKPDWKAQATRAAEKNGLIPVVVYQYDRRDVHVALPMSAIGRAFGQEWPGDDWAEITLEALAYLAGELMAERRA